MFIQGSDDDDHDHRLQKSDPFIDEFVTGEYTDYLAIQPKELMGRQVLLKSKILLEHNDLSTSQLNFKVDDYFYS
jgi:hypothetical protein